MRTMAGRRLLMAGIALLAAGGLLAACGDDNKKTDTGAGSSTTEAGTSSESTTTSAPAADLTVTVKEQAKLGTILADPDGRTLYTLTDASGKAVDCTAGCLAAWPPLKLAAGATDATGPDGVTLTVVDGPDGTKLVASDGLPLYTFAGDGKPTDANGEGLASFGGTWHVVKTTAPVTAPASSGGSGGGDTSSTTSDSTTTTSTY